MAYDTVQWIVRGYMQQMTVSYVHGDNSKITEKLEELCTPYICSQHCPEDTYIYNLRPTLLCSGLNMTVIFNDTLLLFDLKSEHG